MDAWGTYADVVKVPASTVQIVPDTLDFITAAVVGRHGPLAFTQLGYRAQVKPGEWVLVMGAAGGLGSALVQAAKHLARASSPRPAATNVSQPPSNSVADGGINYRSQDLTVEARRITDGAGSMSCWIISAIRSHFRKHSLRLPFRGGS